MKNKSYTISLIALESNYEGDEGNGKGRLGFIHIGKATHVAI